MWKNVYYFLGDLGCNETKRKLLVFDLQICIIICVTHSIGQRYFRHCVRVCVVCVRGVCVHTCACVCKCNTIQYNEDALHYIIHTVQVIR